MNSESVDVVNALEQVKLLDMRIVQMQCRGEFANVASLRKQIARMLSMCNRRGQSAK